MGDLTIYSSPIKLSLKEECEMQKSRFCLPGLNIDLRLCGKAEHFLSINFTFHFNAGILISIAIFLRLYSCPVR